METIVNGNKKPLLTKERKIGSEAPAISLVMQNGESKVIGMMATKVQVIFTLPYASSLSEALRMILEKHQDKAFVYFVGSEALHEVDSAIASFDFIELSKKFGVYIDDTLCAKSLFIIDKDGQVVYKEITADVEDEFDLDTFHFRLNEAILFKKKGHVHENWMGA